MSHLCALTCSVPFPGPKVGMYRRTSSPLRSEAAKMSHLCALTCSVPFPGAESEECIAPARPHMLRCSGRNARHSPLSWLKGFCAARMRDTCHFRLAVIPLPGSQSEECIAEPPLPEPQRLQKRGQNARHSPLSGHWGANPPLAEAQIRSCTQASSTSIFN